MLGEYFFLAFRNLRKRKLRSWLTMIGIFIGIAAVVALISVTLGLQKSIQEQFETMGANKLIIMPGGGMMGVTSAEKLTPEDLDAIRKTKGVDLAAEMIFSTTLVKFEDKAKQTFVIGLPTDETAKIMEDMGGFKVEKGRGLKDGDREKVVIGYLVAKENGLFENEVSLRDKLIIEEREFKVIGIMKQLGNPSDDSQIYVPLDTAKEILGKEDEIDTIYVQVKSGFAPDEVGENIKEELRDLRNEKEGEETFSVQTFEQLMETFGNILSIIQVVLVGIAAISLLVGGIGIMNTMYMSVIERTREIGIMKAIGARNIDIMTLFLFESGLLGIAGGAIGIAIGIGIGKAVEIIAMSFALGMLKASFPWYLILGALAFSFIVGVISGVLPAVRASKLKPVDALRYE